MSEFEKLLTDLKWYYPLDFFFSFEIWGIVNFRIASMLWNLHTLRFLYYVYLPIWNVISQITGVHINGKTRIGAGIKILHSGGIYIHNGSKIGNNCIMANSVTIGSNNFDGNGSPVIGNNVKIGAGARILGDIILGDNCMVGANAVVVKSFPKNSVLAGVPARIIN